jgi:hypothetical protein
MDLTDQVLLISRLGGRQLEKGWNRSVVKFHPSKRSRPENPRLVMWKPWRWKSSSGSLLSLFNDAAVTDIAFTWSMPVEQLLDGTAGQENPGEA